MSWMFRALERDVLTLRIYGTATTLHPCDTGWAAATRFPKMTCTRQIFDMQIQLVNMSGLLFMAYQFELFRSCDDPLFLKVR